MQCIRVNVLGRVIHLSELNKFSAWIISHVMERVKFKKNVTLDTALVREICIGYIAMHKHNKANLNPGKVSWKLLPLNGIVLRKRNAVFEIRGRVFNRCNRFILYSPLEAAAAWNSLRCLTRQCCHWKYFSKIVS